MGVTFSTLWQRIFSQPEVKICILGLDNAGKTTILYKITMGAVVATAPTVGSNHENYTYKNLRFSLWDVGGQTSLRQTWSQYLTATKAVIFVVDSTDRTRTSLGREELHRVCADEATKGLPLLVFANKQDIGGCMSAAEISTALSLTNLKDRQWQIVGCSAMTGKGLEEGLDWLAGCLTGS